MKENGKGEVDFVRLVSNSTFKWKCKANSIKAQKDLPIQLLTSTQPLRATLLLASFGISQGFSNHVFNLDVKTDPNVPLPV